MNRELRPSVRATYDSRVTGPRYHVTTTIGREVMCFQQPIPDPFARTTVHVGWPALLRGLLRRRLVVEVTIGGDREIVNDVLELDENTLIVGRTRQAAFRQSMHQKLRAFADEEVRRG